TRACEDTPAGRADLRQAGPCATHLGRRPARLHPRRIGAGRPVEAVRRRPLAVLHGRPRFFGVDRRRRARRAGRLGARRRGPPPGPDTHLSRLPDVVRGQARLRAGARPDRDPPQAAARRGAARLASPAALERPQAHLRLPGLHAGRHRGGRTGAAVGHRRTVLRHALAPLACRPRAAAARARCAAARFADESPTWSPDGRSLLFVRERNGYGRLMLLRDGALLGPFANLGYSRGFYGHHDWGLAWRR